jgi:hypothetical protein
VRALFCVPGLSVFRGCWDHEEGVLASDDIVHKDESKNDCFSLINSLSVDELELLLHSNQTSRTPRE